MRPVSIALLLACAAAICAFSVYSRAAHASGEESRADDEQENEGDSRVRQGYAISPVALNLKGRDRALVGLGSYLVNAVAGCNDCHTHPNFAPGGRQFGPFVSRNLTPESPSGNPAGLTLARFTEVFRKGTDFDHAHPQISNLLQAMPWPAYRNLTDRDIRAIYEFLSAIPHAETGPVGP